MEIKKIIVGELQTNCYLLIDGGELAVIDAGADALKIGKEIADTEVIPKFIINTHCHPDHIGANHELKRLFSSQILVGEKEENFTGCVPDGVLSDGQTLEIGGSLLKAIHAPGHTRGSICLLGDGFAVTGDVIFADGIGRTDLAGGSAKEMAESLAKLDREIAQGTTIYPGHGDIFTYEKGMFLPWIEQLC